MPYNEEIDSRIKQVVSNWKNTGFKRMFGGICHLLNGNMFCGVYKDFLILRLGEENAVNALKLPYAKPFDITGRPMKNWVMIKRRGFNSDNELKIWLNQAREFVSTLPPK